MRISKGRKSGGGGRDERRRSRERAREARLRREELERRAAELAAAAATSSTKSSPVPNEGDGGKGTSKTEKPKGGSAEDLKAKKTERSGAQESKPKAEEHSDGPKKSKPKAEDRSDGPKKSKPKADDRSGPQRRSIPARGKASGRRAVRAGREAGRRLALPRLAAAARRPVAWILSLLRLVGYVVFWLLARIDRIGRAVVSAVSAPASTAVNKLGRTLTPSRMAIAVAVLAGAAVLAAQLIDYRAVAIGEAAYADVASIAQAPLTGHETPWGAHGPLVGLLAIVGTGGAVMTLRGGGRRSALVAFGAIALALLVILAVDLPRSGDLGAAADEYAGTGSVLLEGFYIELMATLVIGFTATLPVLWRSRPETQPSLRSEKRRTA